MSRNALNWFEIPATDFDRAVTFYTAILAADLMPMDMGSGDGTYRMAILPGDMDAVGGAVVKGDGCNPSADGTIVYLNANPDLQHVLDRVPGAGGTVVVPKTQLPSDFGNFAMIIDSEGNRVGLHSNS